jgi:VCBS repeat-containing protein
MATTLTNGLLNTIELTPNAKDDSFTAASTGLTEDSNGIVWLAVMANDLGGAAKILYSLDNASSTGGTRPTDLLTQDTVRTEALSLDSSLNGARIWITSDGRVGYDAATLSAAFRTQLQHLNPGQYLTDTFTYAIRMSDGALSWATATVQIAGVNDAPVVTGAVTSNAIEDGSTVTVDALSNASDVDSGSTLSVVNVPATLPAGVSYSAAIHAFTLNPANADYQYLATGQTTTVTVNYGVTDGSLTTPASVIFTITGTNDAVTITSSAQSGAVVEDAATTPSPTDSQTASGTISFTDVDLADGHTASFPPNPTALGTFALAPVSEGANAASGSVGWTYTLNNLAAQHLVANQIVTETYVVTVNDGHGSTATQNVVITITGTNDVPTVAGALTTSTAEGSVAYTKDLLFGASDVDDGETATLTVAGVTYSVDGGPVSGTAPAGVSVSGSIVSIDPANAAFDHLAVGKSSSIVLSYNIKDAQGAIVAQTETITISGTNDAPAAVADTNAGKEDATVTGTVATNDSDLDDGATLSYTLNAPVAGLTLNLDGSYSLDAANAAYQHLAEGAKSDVVANYTVTDEHGASDTTKLTITLTGVNDAAAIGGVSSGSVKEDTDIVAGNLATSGLLTITDADTGEESFTAQPTVAGTYGTFTLAANGAWTYSVNNSLLAVQALNTGQSLPDSFTAKSLDGSASQLVTVTINGLDDIDAIIGTADNDTFSFSATATGVHTISDPGGKSDSIAMSGNNTLLTVLNFEKIGSDLVIDVNNQDITVLNHFAGNAVETITFAAGQSYAGYALAGSYNILSDPNTFVGPNGNSADVIAGTSAAQTIDGGNIGGDLLFGNGGDDTLLGRAGTDLLAAGAGNDKLQGGDGNDVLVGGVGNDTFIFDTALNAANNVDRIADFQATATDKILLSHAIFNLATPGSAAGTVLQATEFGSTASAATATFAASVRVIFDTTTGNLFFDANGGDTTNARTLFATIDLTGLSGTVDAADFLVGL